MGELLRLPVLRDTVGSADGIQLSICLVVIGGVISAAYGGAVCLAAKRARNLPGMILKALVLGHLLGAFAGTTALMLDHIVEVLGPSTILHRIQFDRWMMHRGVLAHAISWGFIGVSVGLSAGLVLQSPASRRSSITGASTGALLGAVLSAVLDAALLPIEKVDRLIPTGTWSQLLWIGLPTILIGVGLFRNLQSEPLLSDIAE